MKKIAAGSFKLDAKGTHLLPLSPGFGIFLLHGSTPMVQVPHK